MEFAGKTAAEWVRLLRTGWVYEQCAAALALAEFDPKSEPGRSALMKALNDPEPSVRMAVQIAIGFVHIPAENRRKMFADLTGTDDFEQHATVLNLAGLTLASFQGTTSGPDADEVPATDLESRKASELTTPPTPSNEPVTDIAVVTVAPWWLLFIAVAACMLLAWLLRSVWWAKWAMVALAVLGGVFLFFMLMRQQGGSLSLARFRARARLGSAAIAAGALGFAIAWFVPAGVVLIDNASPMNVRLLIDEQEWLSLGAGESAGRILTLGKYRLTVQSDDGKKVLDAHDIEVSDYGPFMLNVLGSQLYFKGTVRYADVRPSELFAVHDKWFRLAEVDYLFREPPESIPMGVDSNRKKEQQADRTFITKATPPRIMAPKQK